MDKHRGRRMMTGLLLVLAFVAIAIVVYHFGILQRSTYKDNNEENISYNPLIGYAVSADYRSAVNENTLVYIDIHWREIEPEKGIYDFSQIYEENHIEEYIAQGKHAVLRFICDTPGEEAHMDIPQWLYEETGDGTFYDISYGKGYSPNYANALFLEEHGKALQEIAKKFEGEGNGTFLAYVELGSLGHWGEWHVKSGEGIVPIPTEEICRKYVQQYVQAFPHTQLMMRRPFLGVKEYGLGVFNDMTGDEEDTREWLDWLSEGGTYEEPTDVHTLYAIKDFYKQGAVGGEFTSGQSWEDMLVTNIDTTKALIKESHMSFIGPKVPHIFSAEAYQEEADEIRQLLGYKLGISEAKLTKNRLTSTWTISLTWNNKGIAPIYYNWPVYLYFYDEKDMLLEKKQFAMDICSIMPEDSITIQNKLRLDTKQNLQVSKIAVGIEDPMTNKPAIKLNNAGVPLLAVIYNAEN